MRRAAGQGGGLHTCLSVHGIQGEARRGKPSSVREQRGRRALGLVTLQRWRVGPSRESRPGQWSCGQRGCGQVGGAGRRGVQGEDCAMARRPRWAVQAQGL